MEIGLDGILSLVVAIVGVGVVYGSARSQIRGLTTTIDKQDKKINDLESCVTAMKTDLAGLVKSCPERHIAVNQRLNQQDTQYTELSKKLDDTNHTLSRIDKSMSALQEKILALLKQHGHED